MLLIHQVSWKELGFPLLMHKKVTRLVMGRALFVLKMWILKRIKVFIFPAGIQLVMIVGEVCCTLFSMGMSPGNKELWYHEAYVEELGP